MAGPRRHAPGRSPSTYTLRGLSRARLVGRRGMALVFRLPGPAPALGVPSYRRTRRVPPEGRDPGREWREWVGADFHVIPCRGVGRHYLRFRPFWGLS